MTNQAIITPDKNLFSIEEEYDPKKQPWFALVQHWIPRLLGIVPLVVLTSSLMSQGGIQFGAEMYLVSLISIFVLLFWYILVYSLSVKCAQDFYVRIKPGLLNNFSDNLINYFLLKEGKPKGLNQIKFLGRGILYKFTSVPWTQQEPHDPQSKTTSSVNDSNDFRQNLILRFALISKSLKIVFLYLFFLRIQVFIALISALLFQTGQVNDIVLAIILDRDWPAFLFAILFAFLLSLLLWHTSRYLTWVVPALKKGNVISTGLFTPTGEMILLWLAWFSLALFTVPIAEQAYGPLIAEQAYGPLKLFRPNYLWHIIFLLSFQAGIIYLWRQFDFPKPTWTPRFRRRFFSLYGFGLILPFLFTYLKAYEIPELVGSLGILFWALSALLIATSIVYQFSILTGIPLLSTLIIGAYFMNINRTNDNHALRLKKPEHSVLELHKKDYKRLPILADKFVDWIKSPVTVHKENGSVTQTTIFNLAKNYKINCEKRNSNKDCRYPIYIASAQGGGIYAAYHTAKTFQTITDNLPKFRNHLFAISSVSGGSVGSAIYANWLRNCSPKDTKEIDNFFDRPRDPLALIVASMFFGDLFQRFYPIPVAAWDRSLGLELAFEPRHKKIINKSDGSNPESTKNECINLNESFYETQGVEGPFYDNKQKAKIRGYSNPTPFLVLNTTEVDNGRRYLISPFRVDNRSTDADFHEPWPQPVENQQFRDMSYSTAAGLSARFPLISPYGFFPEQRARLFIDGGLYDNSGAITATEIVSDLKRYVGEKYIDKSTIKELKLEKNLSYNLFRFKQVSILDKNAIELNSNYANPEQLAKTNKFKFFGWTALTSVFSTRESRTGKAVDIFINNGFKNDNVVGKVLIEKQFLLGGMPSPVFSIPLGWKLSCQARAFINDQLQVNDQYNLIKSRHVFIPCELKNERILKREPVRSRHLIYLMHTPKIFDNEQELSYSINELIREIRLQIDPQEYTSQY